MKQPLLLHICCAPDEAWVVHTLHKQFELYCFFCNPNIHPLNEYELRCKEAAHVAALYSVPFSSAEYAPSQWEEAVTPFIQTPEGGDRCRACFRLRLQTTARFCLTQNIPRFTTVMSVSPHKKITMLNEEGYAAAAAFGLAYECFDFKKKGGFGKSIELSRVLGLYRQNYCGCRLSLVEHNLRIEKKLTENIE